MIALATQLVERQSEDYDSSDLEDCYESRMRAMLDAKTQGKAVQPGIAAAPPDSNVIHLMTALKKSLGGPMSAAQPVATAPARAKAKRADAKEAARKQPGLKLPLQGGKKAAAKAEAPVVELPAPARGRRRAS